MFVCEATSSTLRMTEPAMVFTSAGRQPAGKVPDPGFGPITLEDRNDGLSFSFSTLTESPADITVRRIGGRGTGKGKVVARMTRQRPQPRLGEALHVGHVGQRERADSEHRCRGDDVVVHHALADRLGDVPANEESAGEFEDRGQADRGADRERLAADRGAEGVGNVIGTDVPGHVQACDRGGGEHRRVQGQLHRALGSRAQPATKRRN